MSARRPPRCTSGRRTPPPLRRSRWAQGSHSRRPRQRTSPREKSWPTSALRSVPRTTTLRRWSTRAVELVQDGGVDQRQRAARAARGEGPGPGGVAVALQAPSHEREGLVDEHPGASAAGAITSASTTPMPVGRPRGGQAARSSGATTKPSRISSVVPAGSQIGPEGTPNMTTARGPLPSRAGRRAIHGPAQAKDAASATGRARDRARRATRAARRGRAGRRPPARRRPARGTPRGSSARCGRDWMTGSWLPA